MIVIALGTNLGDRMANLQRALVQLDAAGVKISRTSSVYETAALLPEGAPAEWNIPYLNMVVTGEADDTPDGLLAKTQAIQTEMGREDIGRWGPRIIDIDLLDVNGECCVTEHLTLPHPEMLKRDFVMVPLAEIAPDWQHPLTGQKAADCVTKQGYSCGDHLKKMDE